MIDTDGVMQFANICEVVLYKITAFDIHAREEDFCTIGAGTIEAFFLLQILFNLTLCANQQHFNFRVRVDVIHWVSFCVDRREFEGITFGVQNPKDIYLLLVGTVQEGRLNLGGLPLAGDFSPYQIIIRKYKAVMGEQ